MFLLYNKTCDYSRVNKSQVKILFLGCPNQKLLTQKRKAYFNANSSFSYYFSIIFFFITNTPIPNITNDTIPTIIGTV